MGGWPKRETVFRKIRKSRAGGDLKAKKEKKEV